MHSRQVEAFRTIARTGTVTAAASALHISQPAVSRLLSHLEVRLGFTLFDRRRGRLQLTPEGEAFLREVDQHFVGLDALAEAGRRIAMHGPETLRLIGIPSVTSGIAPLAAAEMLRRHPSLRLTIDTETTDRIAERVAGGSYDLGFATAPVVTRGAVESRVLVSRPWVCIFPPGHPLEGLTQIEARRLAEVSLIGFSPGMSLRSRVDQEFASVGVEPRFSASGQTVETLCAMVAAGVAGAVIHPFAGHVAARHGLETTEISNLQPLDLVLVNAVASRLSQVAEEFVQVMEDVPA